MNRDRDTEKQIKKLINMGKQKGYVTYDEVNAHMPESVLSADAIDDWLGALGDEGIEVVDAAGASAKDLPKDAKDGNGKDGKAAKGQKAKPMTKPAPPLDVPALEEDEEASEAASPEAEAQEEEKEEKEEDEDFDGGYSKTNDPVRMYLRKMGSVALLTREGEVEIAKRIEEGEHRVLNAILS